MALLDYDPPLRRRAFLSRGEGTIHNRCEHRGRGRASGGEVVIVTRALSRLERGLFSMIHRSELSKEPELLEAGGSR